MASRTVIIPSRKKLIGGQARQFNGTNNFVRIYEMPIKNLPLTMSCWAKPEVIDNGRPFWAGKYNSNEHYNTIYFRDPPDSDVIAMSQGTAGYVHWRSSELQYEIGKWYQCTATFTTEDQQIWVNGSNAFNAGASNPGAINRTDQMNNFAIGADLRSAGGSVYFTGAVFACSVWDVVLSNTECKMLWNAGCGLDAELIRPESLRGNWYLNGNLLDSVRQNDGAAGGGPNVWVNSPLIQSRTEPQYITIPAATPSEYQPLYPDIFSSPIIGT